MSRTTTRTGPAAAFIAIAATLALALALLAPQPAHADSHTLSVEPGAGTLQTAILLAEADPTITTLVLEHGTYTGSGAPSTFTIIQPLTIIGAGSGNNPAVDTILDGEEDGRVLNITANGAVTLENLRVTNGRINGDDGGGIRVSGNTALTLNGVAVVNNQASGVNYGGGIMVTSGGSLTIDGHSEVSGNTAGFWGGGIQFLGGGLLTVSGIISNNTAQFHGGIAMNEANHADNSIHDTRITGNHATGSSSGSAISLQNNSGSRLTLTNVTIRDNTGGDSAITIYDHPDNQLTAIRSAFVNNNGHAILMAHATNGSATVTNNYWGCDDPTLAHGDCATFGGPGVDNIDRDNAITSIAFDPADGIEVDEGAAFDLDVRFLSDEAVVTGAVTINLAIDGHTDQNGIAATNLRARIPGAGDDAGEFELTATAVIGGLPIAGLAAGPYTVTISEAAPAPAPVADDPPPPPPPAVVVTPSNPDAVTELPAAQAPEVTPPGSTSVTNTYQVTPDPDGDPVALDLSVPPSFAPDAATTDLFVAVWDEDEQAWRAIPAEVEQNADGSFSINTTVDQPGTVAVFQQPGRGTFVQPPTPSGPSLVQWNGGSVTQIADGTQSVWITVGGQLLSYTPGAPAIANAAFLAQFPGGEIPPGTLVVTRMP